jgi:hypothetical protein
MPSCCYDSDDLDYYLKCDPLYIHAIEMKGRDKDSAQRVSGHSGSPKGTPQDTIRPAVCNSSVQFPSAPSQDSCNKLNDFSMFLWHCVATSHFGQNFVISLRECIYT